MARFVASKNLVALLASSRRGFASAARSSRGAAEERMMMMRASKEGSASVETVRSASWVPDPVTGYYRPANRVGEMDPAELRQILLSRKST